MERLVDPIMTDVRLESQVARRSGHIWASRWRTVTGIIALMKALAVYGCVPREWHGDDRRAVARTIRYATAMTGAGMLLLIVPPLAQWPGRSAAEPFTLAIYLLPQAFPVALPIGVLVGVLYGLRNTRFSLRSCIAVLMVAAACSAASLVALGWVVPHSNQAFRVAAMQNPTIERGANELTFSELWRQIRSGRASTETAMSYHSRWALAAAPSVVAMWALLVLARGARRRWLLALTAFATIGGYSGLMNAGRAAAFEGMLSPIVGAWLANLAFMAITLRLAATTVVPRPTTQNVERRT